MTAKQLNDARFLCVMAANSCMMMCGGLIGKHTVASISLGVIGLVSSILACFFSEEYAKSNQGNPLTPNKKDQGLDAPRETL